MVEIWEQTSRDGKMARLEALGREDCAWLAVRAAMRVLPLYWAYSFKDRPGTGHPSALPLLRAALMVSVFAKTSSAEVESRSPGGFTIAPYGSHGDDVAASMVAAASTVTRSPFALPALEAIEAAGLKGVPASVALDLENVDARLENSWPPLWREKSSWADTIWVETKAFANAPQWTFWVQWYENIRNGHQLNWPMLEQIALIENQIWETGPEAVAEAILAIEEDFRTKSKTELFNATLYDFEFDKLSKVMRAVPMLQDWKNLTDPTRLDSFLTDALDLREDLIDVWGALSAEGTAMQGAGAATYYMNKVLGELENAETVGALRVGKLVEWGGFLEGMAIREDTQREFASMAPPFAAAVDKLKDLIRDHFAQTLARFAVLRDIRLDDGDDYWVVNNALREILARAKSGADGLIPALAAEDIDVLEDVVDSIGRRLRELEQTQSDESRSSLRRDIDFQMAKVGATAGVYAEKAKKAANQSGQVADDTLKWTKRAQGLWSLVKAVKDFLG